MYYPSLQNMKRHQIEHFNEIKALLKQGKIPAGMVNPAIIKMHNDNSPQVARIDHSSDELSLDALAILYASDGIAARKHWRDTVHHEEPAKEDADPDFDLDLSSLSRRDRHIEAGLSNV